jgi:LacI family transcriptional regulator
MTKRKKVRIKDIAKALGISHATVSQALNHPREVSRATVRSVVAKCEELGYIKKAKVSKRKGVIGIVAQDIYNLIYGEYYNHILVGILKELQKRELRVEVELVPEGGIPLMVSKNSVDGILLFGKIKKELVLSLKQKGIPMILVGHPIPHIELHTVMADGRSGMYAATKHLIELGHRSIALVYSSPLHDYITADRIAGYKVALTEANIKHRDEYLVKANWCHPESAYEATVKLLELKQPPTAIVYMNDTMAYRSYKAFKKYKLNIPRDISVVGFDDMTLPDYIEPYKPSLTTVSVNQDLIGKTAVDVLMNLIEKPSKIALRYTLPVELVIKESSGKNKG